MMEGGWQLAVTCACAVPELGTGHVGVVLGLLLVARRQRVVGVLLLALGLMPLLLLSPESPSPRAGETGLHGTTLVLAVL